MAIPAGWERLGFTSGRRTHRGNKLVGGVPNSDHLSGTAGDFTASVAALREFFGPNVRILDEGDHRHVSGLTDVPFHGRQGIAGLVDGIDTTAPRREAKQMIGASPYPLTPGQPDPLAPLQSPLPPVMQPQSSLAAIMQQPPVAAQEAPAAKKPGFFGEGGKGWSILGIIGDAVAQHYGLQPIYGQQMAEERENNRQLQMWREKVAAERAERMSQPYRFQNNAGDVVELVPGTGQTRVLYADPNARPDWQRIENADGSITMQPVPSANRPTAQHIQALIANPDRAAEFDAKFGRGMSAYILQRR